MKKLSKKKIKTLPAGVDSIKQLLESLEAESKIREDLNKKAYEKWAKKNPKQAACNHGIIFDEDKSKDMTVSEIRHQYPRLYGPCPHKCGFSGIGYASFMHYIMGDW